MRDDQTYLSRDQIAVLDVLEEVARPVSPREVAVLMGPGRTPGGAGQTLSSLYRYGLVDRCWGERTALYRLKPGEAA